MYQHYQKRNNHKHHLFFIHWKNPHELKQKQKVPRRLDLALCLKKAIVNC